MISSYFCKRICKKKKKIFKIGVKRISGLRNQISRHEDTKNLKEAPFNENIDKHILTTTSEDTVCLTPHSEDGREITPGCIMMQSNDDDNEKNDFETNITRETIPPQSQINEGGEFALQLTSCGSVKQLSLRICSCPNIQNEKSGEFVSPFSNSKKTDRALFNTENADDFLPLHIACLFRASPDVIQSLINAYPHALKQKNRWGMLPLHIVAANVFLDPPCIHVSHGNIKSKDVHRKKILMRLYEEVSFRVKGDTWEIEKVVESLLSYFPQSAHIPSNNADWMTSFEYAQKYLTEGQSKEHVMYILQKKRIMQVQGEQHADISPLSIYFLISQQDWKHVIHHLSQYPEDASFSYVESDYDIDVIRLPIHLACSLCAPLEVIESIVGAYPEGIQIKERREMYPLHLACKHGASLDIISYLLNNFPDAATFRDAFGRLPLHLACVNNSSKSVIELLLAFYPGSESLKVKDYNGHTALTYVDNSWDVITRKEVDIKAIKSLLCQPEDDNMKEIMKQVINQVEYKELSSNDQLENHVLFTEEGADVEAIGILSSDEQEKQVINQVEYKKVSSNDQLENYIIFTEKEACIEAIGIQSSDEQEDESSSESIDNDADYKNFSSCSPLENHGIGTEKEGYIEAISYLLNKIEDNSSSESMESNTVDDTKCLEEHAINQVDNKEYNATKNRKAVSLKVATTEVISHQPIQYEDDSNSENKESNFVEGTKTFKKSAINDVECRKSSSIDS